MDPKRKQRSRFIKKKRSVGKYIYVDMKAEYNSFTIGESADIDLWLLKRMCNLLNDFCYSQYCSNLGTSKVYT